MPRANPPRRAGQYAWRIHAKTLWKVPDRRRRVLVDSMRVKKRECVFYFAWTRLSSTSRTF